MNEDKRREQWQELLDEIHGEIDIDDPTLDLEIKEPGPDDLEVTQIQIIRAEFPSDDNSDLIEATHRTKQKDGSQIETVVRNRTRCPSCHFVPMHNVEDYKGNPPEIKGQCRECGKLTCTECNVKCSDCQRDMCSDCSEGYVTADGPLCQRHRDDTIQAHRHTQRIEIWEQQRADREQQLKYEIQYITLELDAKIQQQQMLVRAFIAQWKHMDRIRKHEIEQKTLELNHIIKLREQALEEFKASAEAQLKKEKHSLEKDTLEFKKSKHNREMDLKRIKHDDAQHLKQRKQNLIEQEARFNQYLERQHLELEKVRTLLHTNHPAGQKKLENLAKTANRMNTLNETPEITIP